MAIPARGGSKGLAGKNVRPLGGKPMIVWTIEAAADAAKKVPGARIVVSTDAPEIRDIAQQAGAEVPYLRSAHLATDTASTADVLIDLLHYFSAKDVNVETVILLQPTSPLRNAGDILAAYELYRKDTVDMVVSVTETKANPYFTLFEENGDGYLRLSKPSRYTRRQDCPPVYEYNGAVYVIRAASLQTAGNMKFNRILKFVMPDERSVDIDTQFDFDVAEYLLKKNGAH